MVIGERIKALREAKGWSQDDLAKAVRSLGGKLSQQNVGNIETGIVARPKALPEIALALDTTEDHLRTGRQGFAEQAAQGPREPVQQVSAVPAPVGRPDLPVWASAEAGEEGAMILTSGPIDHIHRRGQTRGAFAFFIIGGSMSPAIEHGQQVIVDPAQPPRPGDDCVFIHDDGDGTMLALVKRLLRAHPDRWRVRQFDPPKDFDIPRAKWAKALKITEKRYA